jgi:hypothetical protein
VDITFGTGPPAFLYEPGCAAPRPPAGAHATNPAATITAHHHAMEVLYHVGAALQADVDMWHVAPVPRGRSRRDTPVPNCSARRASCGTQKCCTCTVTSGVIDHQDHRNLLFVARDVYRLRWRDTSHHGAEGMARMCAAGLQPMGTDGSSCAPRRDGVNSLAERALPYAVYRDVVESPRA